MLATFAALLGRFSGQDDLAIGTSVLVIVGIEFVQASEGVGYRIWHSWSLFQANRMYVGLCVVALMGFGFGVGRPAMPSTSSAKRRKRSRSSF